MPIPIPVRSVGLVAVCLAGGGANSEKKVHAHAPALKPCPKFIRHNSNIKNYLQIVSGKMRA